MTKKVKKHKCLTVCIYLLGCILIVATIAVVASGSVCSMARSKRETLLGSQFAETTLVTKWTDGLLDETVEAVTDDGQQNFWYTYKFADGTTTTVSSADIYQNLQYEKQQQNFISILKGSDILRRRDTTDDGITYISYKMPAGVNLTLSDGHTVHYDQVIKVADADTNRQINDAYRTIRISGFAFILASVVMVIGFAMLIVVTAVKDRIEKPQSKKEESHLNETRVLEKGECEVLPPNDQDYDEEVFLEDGKNGFPV